LHLLQGMFLDLADAFARDSVFSTDFRQCLFRAVVESVTITNYRRFALVEELEHFLYLVGIASDSSSVSSWPKYVVG